MIVVDSSAVLAVMFGEPLARKILARLTLDDDPIMSTVSYVETGTVLAGRRAKAPNTALAELDLFIADTGIQLVSLDTEQAKIALQARIRFGKGMGVGGTLNLGDTFPYALAISRNVPLLFIGNDFRKTDVLIAL